MSKTRKTSKQAQPPTREEEAKKQAQAEQRKQKKQFIKGLMQSERMVVFTGGNNIMKYGFQNNLEFVWFLLSEIFDLDGKNGMFQRIYQSLIGPPPEQQTAPDETDDLMNEIESEDDPEDGAVSEGDPEEDDPEESEEDPKIIELKQRLQELEARKKKGTAPKDESKEDHQDPPEEK